MIRLDKRLFPSTIGLFLLLLAVACGPGSGTTGGANGDGTGDDDDTSAPSSDVPSSVEPVPSSDVASAWFTKTVTVFGVFIYATADVSDAKVLHAAHVMAQYLDNDEDGAVDDAAVVDSMVQEQATLVMFGNPDGLESSGLFESSWIDQRIGQDLQGDETIETPGSGVFDATLEEVLHLIHSAGHTQVYSEAFGLGSGSQLAEVMDLARGGHFADVPSSYPDGAWYHYDDTTCDYECMQIEYLYWGLTSLLGAQAGRCDEIAAEWEPCTSALMKSMDPGLTGLLRDAQYAMPTVLPDGSYGS